MIQLRNDCLLVAGEGGAYSPVDVEQLTLEVAASSAESLDVDTLKQVAASVLFYFKEELGRTTITATEFGEVFARALRGLGFEVEVTPGGAAAARPADLRQIAVEAGKLGELEFFPLLHGRLKEHLSKAPTFVEFSGLRGCVKILAGRRNWCPRCAELEEKIIDTLRSWFGREPTARGATLVVR